MTLKTLAVRLEQPADAPTIDHLHDVSFGPGRFARAAFRVREGFAFAPELSFVATSNGMMIGSVRLTSIRIGTQPALLLGPLAVLPDFKGKGAGRALLRESLKTAAANRHEWVLLVGDEPYYGPFGFIPAQPGSIIFPAPVDPARVLVCDLRGQADILPHGPVSAAAPAVCSSQGSADAAERAETDRLPAG